MKEGDFVLIEFVGRVAGTGEIFDLTDEETAKKEGIYSQDQKYEPVLVVIGAKMAISGIEKALLEMNPGDEKEFSVKPEDAFGFRNPKLIKIISKANFMRQKIDPAPGIFVTIDGMRARVQSVSGGRVRIDFNHPLAGKELQYRLKVSKQVEGAKEKSDALLHHYGLKCETALEEGNLKIKSKKLPDGLKKMFADEIKKRVGGIKEVRFEEIPEKNGDKPKANA
jgi:FKBP-type peptidyl-prolyl cis-trans isomerase 2